MSTNPNTTKRGFSNFVSGVKNSLNDAAIDLKGIKSAGGNCCTAAKETASICNTTTSKTRQMIDFGLEMKNTLGGGINTKNIASISKVMTSDKFKAVLKIATDLDDLALECVNKSLKMIDSIDAGIESLPDILEKKVDKRMEEAQQNGSKEGDPKLPDLDEDCRELEEAFDSVKSANPLSAVDSFQRAFDGITTKGEICKDMFQTIRAFADDVAGVSDAIHSFSFGKFVGKMQSLVKDIWRCLRLSDLIRSFANAVDRLIKWIIKVIQALLEKVQTINIDFSSVPSCGCVGEMESLLKQSGVNMKEVKKYGEQLMKSLTPAN